MSSEKDGFTGPFSDRNYCCFVTIPHSSGLMNGNDFFLNICHVFADIKLITLYHRLDFN